MFRAHLSEISPLRYFMDYIDHVYVIRAACIEAVGTWEFAPTWSVQSKSWAWIQPMSS